MSIPVQWGTATLGAVAQPERALIAERTKAGLLVARYPIAPE